MVRQASTKVPEAILAGWPLVALSRAEFAELLAADCKKANAADGQALPKLAFSMNGQALSLAESDAQFRQALQAADYLQADGQSLVFASRFGKGVPLPERVATTDFFHDAAELAQDRGIKFFLLGATEQSCQGAADAIRKLYPNLQLVGHRSGYFDASEEADVCREIVDSGAEVLWLGLGKPREQLFCIRNRENLRGVAWIKTCGGLFDFLSGHNKRAPLWMQKAGMEWLYRVLLEPRRLFWRYLTTNIHAIWILALRGRKVPARD